MDRTGDEESYSEGKHVYRSLKTMDIDGRASRLGSLFYPSLTMKEGNHRSTSGCSADIAE